MNLISKLRNLISIDSSNGNVIVDDQGKPLSQLDLAQRVYDAYSEVVLKGYVDLEATTIDFDTTDGDFTLKLQACDVALSKAIGDVDLENNKTILIERRAKNEQKFIGKLSTLIKGIEEASVALVESHEVLQKASGNIITTSEPVVTEDVNLNKGIDEYKDHFVSIVYRDEKGRILLLQREDNKQWMMPGGHIDAGEVPIQAAKREFKEETNIELRSDSLTHAGIFQIPDNKNIYYFTCNGHDNTGTAPIANIDLQNEAINMKFMSVDEWLNADLFKDTKKQLTELLLPKAEVVKAYQQELHKAIDIVKQALSDGFIQPDQIVK